jgi:hypothetical protein
MSIAFTDAKPMILRKILRNNMAKALLKTHISIVQKEIEIRQLYISTCQEKLTMLDTMNLIEGMQISEYSKSREESILETSESISELDDDFSKDIVAMQDYVKKNKNSSYEIVNQIQQLNETIPDEGVATNYKIKTINNDNTGGRCVPHIY